VNEEGAVASEFCLETLLSADEFEGLAQADQAERLARFMRSWFTPGYRLNVVDHVRWTQRISAHAAKLRISVGEAMEILLPGARRTYCQNVYEIEARRIRAEDQEAPGQYLDAVPTTPEAPVSSVSPGIPDAEAIGARATRRVKSKSPRAK
jgi:hypothetical protein